MAENTENSRFAKVTENTIQQLKNGSKNVNTTKSTAFWMNVWSLWAKQNNMSSWAKQNNINEDIASISPENLNSLLERFSVNFTNEFCRKFCYVYY